RRNEIGGTVAETRRCRGVDRLRAEDGRLPVVRYTHDKVAVTRQRFSYPGIVGRSAHRSVRQEDDREAAVGEGCIFGDTPGAEPVIMRLFGDGRWIPEIHVAVAIEVLYLPGLVTGGEFSLRRLSDRGHGAGDHQCCKDCKRS